MTRTTNFQLLSLASATLTSPKTVQKHQTSSMDIGHCRVKVTNMTFTFPMILTLGAGVDEMDPTEDVTDADSAPATMFSHMYSLLSEKLKKEKKQNNRCSLN